MQTKTISSFVNRMALDPALYKRNLASALQAKKSLTQKQRKLLIELRK